jgi:pimeloyl-[acyl-carrier protein] methyl ester esterase
MMTLFFIHGWASNSTVWPRAFIKPTTYLYHSECFPEYSHLDAAFCQAWSEQAVPMTVIGWSLGGMLALQLAAAYPERIGKLILIGSTAKFVNSGDYECGLSLSLVKNLARKLAKNPQQTQLDFYKLMFSANEQKVLENFISMIAPSMLNIHPDSLRMGLDYLVKTDLRSLLPSIKIPSLIIHGTKDAICPIDAAYYLASHLPNSQLISLPEAGHIPFYSQLKNCLPYIMEDYIAHE